MGRVEVTAAPIDALLARDDVLLIAHAGGSVDAPQETMYAYRRAVEAGSDVLELDVMVTSDRALVVHHDQTVDRLTDGTGAVADMTLAEVQALDAAYRFVAGGASGHPHGPVPAPELRGVRTGEVEAPTGF
ncbi:MAG TPA: glycerophosphodiester phosphodiesterase family protein [Acidimicrobiia bacterium]